MKEFTRYVSEDVARVLWAKAAGRCQFKGHNKLLYKSSVTQEGGNYAEKAHIYSFSEKGPRGWGPFKHIQKELNRIDNLMLMCSECHKTIDSKANENKYSAILLREWKNSHEDRIRRLTELGQDRESHVLLYGSNIGADQTVIDFNEAAEAMFDSSYPADDRPIRIYLENHVGDHNPTFWSGEAANLVSKFTKHIQPLMADHSVSRFSVFSLAPQPLLVLLGALLTDKINADVYQLHREPRTWKWQPSGAPIEFKINRTENNHAVPVLVFALSDRVIQERIHNAVGSNVDIWEITIGNAHNDFLRSSEQLSQFRKIARKVLSDIRMQYALDVPLHIIPVMPVSCAVELGRVRTPKTEMPWIIYDQNSKTGGFNEALKLPEALNV